MRSPSAYDKKIFEHWPPPHEKRRKIFGKRVADTRRRRIFKQKNVDRKKVMSGEYGLLNEMTTDINGGPPPKKLNK